MHAYALAIMFGSLLSTDPPHAAGPQDGPGQAVYARSCKSCHGARGVPGAAMAKRMPTLPVLDSAFASTLSLAGVEDAVKNGKGKMKGMSEKLSAEEIAAVSKYVFELTNAKPLAAKGSK